METSGEGVHYIIAGAQAILPAPEIFRSLPDRFSKGAETTLPSPERVADGEKVFFSIRDPFADMSQFMRNIMPDADYLPKADADFAVWLQNFTLKITTVYNTLFGISAGQITAIQNDNTAVNYLITQYLEAFKTATQDRVAYKDLIVSGKIGQVGGGFPSATVAVPPAPANAVAPGVKARVRLLVKQIKANSQYTEVIGEDLGIVAPTPIPNPKPKPRGSAAAQGASRVELKFVKGRYTGVQVESRRGSETVWSVLATISAAPSWMIAPRWSPVRRKCVPIAIPTSTAITPSGCPPIFTASPPFHSTAITHLTRRGLKVPGV